MTRSESYARGPGEPAVLDTTIGEALAAAAREAPDRPALVAGVADPARRRQWSYRELYDEAERAARALAADFRPGERLAVWAPNVPEWVVLEYAAAMAGLVLVTVNPSLQAQELAYVLQQSKSSGIALLPEFRGNPMARLLESVREQCPELRKVIRFDDWPAFLARAERFDGVLPQPRPGDAVMIQYTSGTTGRPKGALLHHRGLVTNGAHTADNNGLQAGDPLLMMMPLFHTSGSVLGVLGAVAKRATMVMMEAFDPGLALELLETYRSTLLAGVPTMLLAIMEHPDFERRDLGALRCINSGGSTVPEHLVRRLEERLGAPFTIVFGQTECSPVATMTRPSDSTEDKAGTLGLPMPNVEVKIVDPATGATVPIGDIGEFCTRGYHVMLGYWDMPEASAQAIDALGWLHTGDLCSMDDRGYCRIEGRLKDMIIRGGENIYPREIEELLFRHPGVAEVAVVGLPDERYGEVVGAFIRDTDPTRPVSYDELRTYCRAHLSPQKTPSVWQRVDAFPLTGSGKIQKFVLRERWLALA